MKKSRQSSTPRKQAPKRRQTPRAASPSRNRKVPTKSSASRPSLIKLLKHSSCPLLILTRSGKLLFQSTAAKELLALEPEQFQRDSLKQHPLFRGTPLGYLARTRRWNCVELGVAPTELTKGKPLALSFELGDSGDSPLLVMVAPPDQTESGEAQSSLVAREEFLAGAAHDLKNPLSAVFGYADALLETSASEGLSDQQRSLLGRIRSTAHRSIELIRNYQQLAELSAQRLRLSDAPSDLGAACQTIANETFREDPSAHTVRVLLAESPLPVAVDRIPLERILTNLFANALRYTPAGETITLRTSLHGKFAVVEVTNAKPIIPTDELPKIFTRRFRGSTSTGTSGTGLGLYIVKRMVHELGGEVSVRSALPEGTTFTVALPLAKSRQSKSSRAKSSRAKSSRAKSSRAKSSRPSAKASKTRQP